VTRLLAIDTSTWWGGAALVVADGEEIRVAAEVGLLVEDSHAARLLSLVTALLDLAACPKESIDAYAAVRGPGSFTGIRVGLGMLRGFAIATGKPCLGVGTLEAMAEAFGAAACDRVPLVDAGRGEVYGARYDPASSPPEERVAPWVGPVELALRGAAPAAVTVFGGGAVHHRVRLEAAGVRIVAGRVPAAVAAGAGRIALRRLAAGTTKTDAAPLYVRPSDAEVKKR
jgi:tRNA threonylcarbamoyladenosine biosynthesis protein TsaB